VSLDLSIRYPFHFKYTMFSTALDRGVRIEMCYGPGVAALDSNSRRNVIENATALIRVTRGRGLIISSEAASALACRAPDDIINLAAVWGLGQERGVEAVTKEARSVVVTAQIKRTSYRGVVDVIYGGERPVKETVDTQSKIKDRSKRKAAEMSVEAEKEKGDAPLSKRQMKKMSAAAKKAVADSGSVLDEKNKVENSTSMVADKLSGS